MNLELQHLLDALKSEKVRDITERFQHWPNRNASRLDSGWFGTTCLMKRPEANAEVVVVKEIRFWGRDKPNGLCDSKRNMERFALEVLTTRALDSPLINRSKGLHHTDTHVYLVLENIREPRPDIRTRLYFLFARFNVAGLGEVDRLTSELESQILAAHQNDPVEREYDIHAQLDRLYKHYVSPCAVEYPTGQDLTHYVEQYQSVQRPIPEEKIRIIVMLIARALFELRKHKIVHRDIKAENIILDERRTAKPIYDPKDSKTLIGVRLEEEIHVQLIDFGMVKILHCPDDVDSVGSEDTLNSESGTRIFASLEHLEGIHNHGCQLWQTKRRDLLKLDVYGLGTVLYCLMFFVPPFVVPAHEPNELRYLINQMRTVDPVARHNPPAGPLTDLVRRLLCMNVDQRPSINEVLDVDILKSIRTNVYFQEIFLDPTVPPKSGICTKIIERPRPLLSALQVPSPNSLAGTQQNNDGGMGEPMPSSESLILEAARQVHEEGAENVEEPSH